MSADETPPTRLDDLDTGFRFDPADPLAPIRHAVKDAPEDQRTQRVGEALEVMAEIGMSTAVAGAIREYLKQERLFPLALFDEIRRNVRRGGGRKAETSLPASPKREPAHLHIWPSWASDQDILTKLMCDLGSKCALTGEHRNAKLTYLALQSRRLSRPVSIVVKGQSASGKSYTVQCVLHTVPPAAVMVRTGLSELALVYSKESFAHRTIIIFEAVALKESKEKNEGHQGAMILRTLMSEGVIRHETTVKNEFGEFETAVYEKEGPTNCILTTTADSLHQENETRMLTLSTDDSKEQTRRVMLAAAAAEDLEGEPDFTEWHQLDAALDGAVHDVTVPYRAWLAHNIPAAAVRLRRDFPMLLTFIRTHAMIHQLQRTKDDRGRVMATQADYNAVRKLVSDLMSDQVGVTVKQTMRQTVETVDRLDPEGKGGGVTVDTLAAELKLDRTTAQRRASAAAKRGYLVNAEAESGRGRKAARYVTGEPLPAKQVMLPDLPEPEVWRECACTYADPDAHFPDNEAAGQDEEPGKSANVQASSGVKDETSEDGTLALLGAHLGAVLLCPDCGAEETSHLHGVNCLGQDPAA